MPPSNLEYLNLNSQRAYPIRDELSRTDPTGQFFIPNNFIVEFSLAASNSAADRFFISSILNQITQVVIEISDQNNVIVGSFNILASSFTEYATYTLAPNANSIYSTANGRMTIGSLSDIQLCPAGLYTFDITTTELLPRTIIPSLLGINSLTFTDDLGTAVTVSGNVTIVARTNLQFTYNSGSNTLTIDAGNGLGLNTICTPINPILSINGVTPDDTGNISLLPLGCIEITTTSQNTLNISDSCCTPCSGCDDLAELTQRCTQLEAKYLDLKNNVSLLAVQLNTFTLAANSNCSCP